MWTKTQKAVKSFLHTCLSGVFVWLGFFFLHRPAFGMHIWAEKTICQLTARQLNEKGKCHTTFRDTQAISHLFNMPKTFAHISAEVRFHKLDSINKYIFASGYFSKTLQLILAELHQCPAHHTDETNSLIRRGESSGYVHSSNM